MKEFDKINMIYGAVAAVGVAIFGKYWFLFAGFLILNAVDYVTGYCKARFYNKNESSAIGAKGIFKKVWYWIVIGIAFFIATCFTYMGDIVGVDLGFVLLFGWFTLATYIVNETPYTKNFIYKTFATSNIGISIKKAGHTDESLNFDV